jgi:hypothetical protein
MTELLACYFHDAVEKVMIEATRQRYIDQKRQAEFALALIAQVPPELVPLLTFPTPKTCFIAGTQIELVYTGTESQPRLQRYRLILPTWEHYDDYRMALARHADIESGKV